MENIINIIHLDIKAVLSDWKAVCQNHKLLEMNQFLEKMQNHILLLDTHCEGLTKKKQIHSLLVHVLHTPPGAPIAIEKPLADCAKEYQSKSSKDSLFYQYLKRSLTSCDENDNYLFNSLLLLDEKLETAI